MLPSTSRPLVDGELRPEALLSAPSSSRPSAVLHPPELNEIVAELEGRGYTLIAPTVWDGAVVLRPLGRSPRWPAGWRDTQEPGMYRIKKSRRAGFFGWAAAANSAKAFLFPSETRLFSAEWRDHSFEILDEQAEAPKYAFVGVRPCDVEAIRLLDQVLLDSGFVDDAYRRLRDGCAIVVVNCTQPSSTCFCTSMGTGPRANGSYDLALTELDGSKQHLFVAESGSTLGDELLAAVGAGEASEELRQEARDAVDGAAAEIGRAIQLEGLRELLYQSFDHSHWDEIAERCLTCGNCTMVCPTCFCSTVEENTDLAGQKAERWRRWDSCFTQSFSYIHGGSVRLSAKSRYRQKLTHKFAAWQDQFGEPGCVGCGRCTVWCPAGIDLTAELAALREKVAGAGAETGPDAA